MNPFSHPCLVWSKKKWLYAPAARRKSPRMTLCSCVIWCIQTPKRIKSILLKTLSLTLCAPCKQLRLGVNSAKNTKPPVKLGISKHCLIFFRSTLAWIVLRQGFVVKKRYQSNDRDYIASHFCNWCSIFFVKSQSVNLDSVFFEATNKCLLLYSGLQACRPWVCRVCHGTPRFWQIS